MDTVRRHPSHDRSPDARSDLDQPRGNEGTVLRLVRRRVALADDRPVIVALPALEHIDQLEERGGVE